MEKICIFDFGVRKKGNLSLHTGQLYNAFNPCTQAYTNIDKYSTCKFSTCTFFHVIHTHGYFKLPYPSSQIYYNHSYENSHRNIHNYVAFSSWQQPIRKHSFSFVTKDNHKSQNVSRELQYYLDQ